MRATIRAPALVALAAGALAAGAAPAAAAAQQPEHPGKAPYDKWCAACHGVDGDGDGPAAAWMLPRPRDFRDAQYQIRTTPSGALPTDADIRRIIDDGMPGTAMPGWRGRLSRSQRDDLVDYLKTFSRFFEMEDAPPPIAIGRAPRITEERVRDGARLYQEIECWTCHGDAGRGDGPSAPTQTDEGGFPVRPADLTANWRFTGGGSLEAIHTRLMTGLDGTPMPSFADLIDGGVITEDEMWSLAMFVRSLAPERAPEARDVIRAARLDGPLPASLDDAAWDDVARHYVPLVGQIIVEPRWFAATVTGIWVQAAHDGRELVMRLSWNDPSRSPDPAWEEWRERVVATLEPREGPAPEAGAPDALTIQFPTVMPVGRDLPFFLGGSTRAPVYLLRWRSDRAGLEEALGRGIDLVEPLPPGDVVPTAESRWEEGAWRLIVRRGLETDDPERRMSMAPGEPIPVAFFARDGSNAETGHRGAISSWYFLHLDTPVPTTVYTAPIAATLLTALLGLGIVARARRDGRRRAGQPETLTEGA